jgi:hypothetical protein
MQVTPEIHHQQAIVIMRPKEAQHKCFRPQHRAVYTARALRPKHRVYPQELQRFFLLRPDP